jgi:hypothetical protein
MTAGRVWSLMATVVGAGATALYLGVIIGEGDNTILGIAPWALVMSLATACALFSTVGEPSRWTLRSLRIATAIFAIVGVLGIFTIGLLFLVAAVCAGVGLAVSPRGSMPDGDAGGDGDPSVFRLPGP